MEPHQLTSNVKLLQKVVLHWQGKVLMLQRSGDSLSRPNCWDLPGGNSEWPQGYSEPISDLHKEDAAREVEEETGIIIDPNLFTLNNLSYLETFFDPDKQIFTVLLGWSIELNELPSDVVISHEHTSAQWVSPKEALSLDFGGQKGAFLSKILSASH